MGVAGAFFDLDKTVIAKSSTLAFSRPMFEAGMLSRSLLLRVAIAQTFYSLFGADHDKMERAREGLLALVKGWDQAQLSDLVEETLEEVISPLVYAEALFLIDEHHREGRRVFIVSSSPEEVVRPLARYLGVTDVVATRAGVDDNGHYTGELEFYAYGETKAEALARLEVEEDIDLAASYAYSDSITDLPMLEAVGNPSAVNPDKELRRHAEEHGWPILEFRLPVDLRTRLAEMPRPDPVVSGAALAVAAAVAVGLAVLRYRRSHV